MKEYTSPDLELIVFGDDVLTATDSQPCKCFIEDQVVDDITAAGSSCYTDTEGADAYNVHGKVV